MLIFISAPAFDDGERQYRQGQPSEGRPQGGEVAGDQAVEGVEAGDGGRRVYHRVNAPEWCGCDAGERKQKEDQQQADPEIRDRARRQAIDAAAIVNHALGSHDGDDGDADGEYHGQKHGIEDQFQRCRCTLHQVGRNRIGREQRYAEITLHDIAHIVDELLPQRTVQAKLLAKIGDAFGRRHVAEHQQRRVAGQEPHQNEGDKDHADRLRHHHRQTRQYYAQRSRQPLPEIQERHGSIHFLEKQEAERPGGRLSALN